MPDWELIDDGSFNGVKKYIRATDDDHGTVSVRYEGHDAPIILERNKRAQNEARGPLGEMVHAAHIPASILLQWFQEDGVWAVNDMEYMTRKLNDPDWRYLKRLPITL